MMKLPLIRPYLYFNGRCEEALEFYKNALNAKIGMVMRFRESPDPAPPGMLPEGWEAKIMHAEFSIGDNVVMASDGCGPANGFEGFSLSISVATPEEVDRCCDALAVDGQVTMPVGETFWSPRFGMVSDRFGLSWAIGVHAEPPSTQP